MTELIIPKGVEIIEGGSFEFTDLVKVSLPSTLSYLNERAFNNCHSLSNIIVNRNNPTYVEIDGCVIEKSTKKIVLGISGAKIPGDGSAVSIGNVAFSGRTFDELYIPDTITYIHEAAFDFVTLNSGVTIDPDNTEYHADGNCIIHTKSRELVAGFSNSVIPDDGSVQSLGEHAFYGSGITNLVIPDSVTQLRHAALSVNDFTQIAVPDGVEILYEYLFVYCHNLEEVYIPSSVKSIYRSVFDKCESLKRVYFGGSEDEWKAISIDKNNGALDNCEFVFGASREDIEYAEN